jgi:hypothetical protein
VFFGILAFLLAPAAGAEHTTALVNFLDGKPIDASARKLVILIHGWNPGGDTDAYQQDAEWRSLRDNLQNALVGSDWKLVLYHWEELANTGSTLNLVE